MNGHELRLLLADDEKAIRTVLRRLLTRMGYERIDEAQDGVEALRLFRLAAYDLVVTDLNMPRMNGLQLLREIRDGDGDGDGLGRRRRTPVLMVSGQLSEERIQEAVAAGVDGFVGKPFVEASLAENVERLLRHVEVPAPSPSL